MTKRPRVAPAPTIPRTPQSSQAGKKAPKRSKDGAPAAEQPLNRQVRRGTAVRVGDNPDTPRIALPSRNRLAPRSRFTGPPPSMRQILATRGMVGSTGRSRLCDAFQTAGRSSTVKAVGSASGTACAYGRLTADAIPPDKSEKHHGSSDTRTPKSCSLSGRGPTGILPRDTDVGAPPGADLATCITSDDHRD